VFVRKLSNQVRRVRVVGTINPVGGIKATPLSGSVHCHGSKEIRERLIPKDHRDVKVSVNAQRRGANHQTSSSTTVTQHILK
jgi:hypothetical protein